LYVSTSGGSVGGVQSTNAVAGTVRAGAKAPAAATVAADAARNQALNSIASTGRGNASTGTAVSTSQERMIPLAAFTHSGPGSTPLAVTQDGMFVATTISFNLAPGVSLGDASSAVTATLNRIGVPASIHGEFRGTTRVFQQSLATEPYLI